jgi:nucleotide-binding universal stress UspA family protein
MAEERPLFSNILVPVDGSQSSINAGRLAVRLAALARARLTFCYVVDQQSAQRIAESSQKDPRLVEAELAASGDRSRRNMIRLAEEAGVPAEQTIHAGEPFREIGDLARETSADLIIIGQIGRGGLQRVLIGGVTERVIENTACPVLVVR